MENRQEFVKDIKVLASNYISREYAIDDLHGRDPSQIWDTADIEVWLNALPSAESDVPDTNVGELISRQAAVDEIDEWIKAFRENGHKESAADACLIQDGIIQLPSSQPERKKGKWRRRLVDSGFNADWHCSECGWKTSLEEHGYNFCPNCGADMRGEQDG